MATLTEYDWALRFVHVLAGIVWIGHLYFFNLTNLPLLKLQLSKPYTVDMAEKATANISLKALFWFRWGAMFTLLAGLGLLEIARRNAGSMGAYFLERGPTGHLILMGVVFAVVMWFNVWFIIWPNQQKILTNNKRIAAGVSDEEKKRLGDENAPRVKTAVMASRINTWLSIPMLFGMILGTHASVSAWRELQFPLVVLGVVLALAAIYANTKPKTKSTAPPATPAAPSTTASSGTSTTATTTKQP